jgi:peptide-methionine (S)-S-oxide reductase
MRMVFAAAVVAATFVGAPVKAADTAVAVFAGGCFWCVEADFDKLPGVVSTVSGYTGGTVKDPGYHLVSAGGTGHAEAVEVVYDPAKVSYAKLLDYFWHHIEESKKAVEAKFAPRVVYTQIVQAGPFYKAEEYHQDYYKKNPSRYKFYRWNCGRDQRIEELWGKEKESS